MNPVNVHSTFASALGFSVVGRDGSKTNLERDTDVECLDLEHSDHDARAGVALYSNDAVDTCS